MLIGEHMYNFNKIKIIFLCFLFILNNNILAEKIQDKNNNTGLFTKEELKYIKTSPTIKIGMMSNFKPFTFIEENNHQGYTLDLLNEISKTSNLKFEIKTARWGELLQNFKDKKLDIIDGISYTKKRENFTLFTDAYYEIPTYIFGLKTDKHYKSIDDLKDKRVAISKSMYYKDTLIKKGVKIIEVSSSNEKAKLLALGNVDYFLASYTSGKKAVVSQSLTSIKPLDEFRGVKKEDLRFGVNKDKTLLYSILQKSLDSINKEKKEYLTNTWILELKELTTKQITFTPLEQEYLSKLKKLNVCIDPNWMPFEKIDDRGKHIGLTKKYMDIFEKELNIPINLVRTQTWNQSVVSLINEQCDMLTLVMKTADRVRYMNFTNTYITTPLVLATKLNVPFIDNLKELENKKVGIVKNYAYFQTIKNSYPNLKVVEVDSIKQGLDLVSQEKIFGFIDSLPTVGYEIQLAHLGELKIAAKFDNKLNLSMATRKNDIILTSIFDKILNNIDDKKKKELLNRYINIQYEKAFDYSLFWQIFSIVALGFIFLIYKQNIQKRSNQKLKESYRKIQTILDTTTQGLMISRNGIIENVNQETLKLLDYKNKSELIGRKLTDCVDDSSKDSLMNKLKENFTEPYELLLKKSDGSTFFALLRGKNVRLEDGKFRVSSIVDLTDIKEKEALIIQQSKVATAGEMLENISHQWRQPLSQISTIASGIKVQKEFGIFNEETLIKDMENINNSAQYLSQTIEDFKDFLKPNTHTSCEINLKDTIKKVKQLTKDAYEYHNIQIVLDTKDCQIYTNENLIIQALLNISNNAKDAILEKNTSNENSFVFISLIEDENHAVITIRDNGGGIKDEIKNKIFEPYFTTKHESIGTGIGLYMTYQIIKKQLDGSISVRNEEFNYDNKEYLGACFKIEIPIGS